MREGDLDTGRWRRPRWWDRTRIRTSASFLGLTLAMAATLAALAAPADLEAQRFGGRRQPEPVAPGSLNPGYDAHLQFVRIRFGSGGGGGFGGFGRREPPWMHDYPRAERNFMRIVDETTYIHPRVDASNILTADDPELFKHPLAYIVEVGFWNPTDAEATNLGTYLRKGGFLIVDDFRDQRGEWANFVHQMGRVLPDHALIALDGSHEIFDSFFRIPSPEALIPATFQQYPPLYYGIFEDNDQDKRLLAIVNFNNDIAEYWEFSDRGWFPIDLSNEAYKLGVNYLVYALTH